MKHVNRLAVGGTALTAMGLIANYVPRDWLLGMVAAVLILGIAYLIGAAILLK